jgi:hypothetical protein
MGMLPVAIVVTFQLMCRRNTFGRIVSYIRHFNVLSVGHVKCAHEDRPACLVRINHCSPVDRLLVASHHRVLEADTPAGRRRAGRSVQHLGRDDFESVDASACARGRGAWVSE